MATFVIKAQRKNGSRETRKDKQRRNTIKNTKGHTDDKERSEEAITFEERHQKLEEKVKYKAGAAEIDQNKNVTEAAAEKKKKKKTEAEKQNEVEAAAWLEKVKVVDEANEASAQKKEIDANAAAAKETKGKVGSTANSQERNQEESFETSPCMPAPRAHVLKHVRVVPVHTETF